MSLTQRVARRYAAKKPVKLEYPIPFEEKDAVIKDLVSAYWSMKEWATRTSLPEMYEFTPELRRNVIKAFHDLQKLEAQIRKL